MTEQEKEDFAAFCGGLDPSTLRPQVRLAMWHKFKAGTPGDSESAKLKGTLELRYGSVDAAPLSERSRLAYLEGPRATSPTRVAPISAADAARAVVENVAAMEAQAEAYERPLAGETVNMMVWRAQQARSLRDRVAGIRRRNPVS